MDEINYKFKKGDMVGVKSSANCGDAWVEQGVVIARELSVTELPPGYKLQMQSEDGGLYVDHFKEDCLILKKPKKQKYG